MPAPRPEYDLHLTEEEATIILQGLGELPSKMSFNLLNRLGTEFAQANKAFNEAQAASQQPAGLMGTPPAAVMPGLQALGDQNPQ